MTIADSGSEGELSFKSIAVLDAQKSAVESDQTLSIEKDSWTNYQLGAQVDLGAKTYTYPADGSLKAFSNGVADDLKWSLEGSSSAKIDANTGMLTITEEGEFTVTCSTTTGGQEQKATVKVSAVKNASDQPKLSSVDILDSKGAAFPIEQEYELTFDKSKLPVKDYKFQVHVAVANATFGGDGLYDFPADGKLSTFSEGVLDDLEWSISNANGSAVEDDAAKIEDGVLTVNKEGTYKVTCVARVKATTEEMPATVRILAGDSSVEPVVDPQGEDHHQNSIQVVSSVKFPKKGEAQDGQESSSSSSTSESSSASSSSSSSSSEADSTSAVVDFTYTHDAASGDKQAKLSDALSFSNKTVSMANASGSSVEITGEGVSLVDLVRDACERSGVDFDKAQIDSVDFVDYRGVTVNLPWSSLQSSGALVADRSYVHVSGQSSSSSQVQTQAEGDESTSSSTVSESTSSSSTDEPSSSSSASTSEESTSSSTEASSSSSSSTSGGDPLQPLDNTRYRILFDSTTASIDTDSLRYINKIQLNGPSTPDPERFDDLTVTIDYTPVPKGVNAEFVAVPSYDITGSWNCIWEVWPKGKEEKDKQVISGESGQTLSVKTSDSTIGNKYRVTIENETGASTPDGKPLKGTSDWVELEEGSGVVLSYNPPKAGDIAIFRTSVYGYKGKVEDLQYAWEWSDNGGKSWHTIEGEDKPTLKIPTDPIDENASSEGGGGGAASLIYIRVLVTTTNDSDRTSHAPKDGWPMKSNVQPLTVHVGDKDTDTGGSNKDGNDANADALPPGGPVNPPSGGPSSGGNTYTPEPVVIPVDNITIDYSPVETEALNPESTQTTQSAPTPKGDPSQLVINDEVSKVINEQQQQAQQQVEATTPGARWTALNTINPTGDEVQRVLENNPIAPLVIPFGLGVMVAGGLEKFLFFRRQLLP